MSSLKLVLQQMRKRVVAGVQMVAENITLLVSAVRLRVAVLTSRLLTILSRNKTR